MIGVLVFSAMLLMTRWSINEVKANREETLYRLDHAKALFIVLSLTILGGIKIDKNGSVANVEAWNEFQR
jgi:hypothetical protein